MQLPLNFSLWRRECEASQTFGSGVRRVSRGLKGRRCDKHLRSCGIEEQRTYTHKCNCERACVWLCGCRAGWLRSRWQLEQGPFLEIFLHCQPQKALKILTLALFLSLQIRTWRCTKKQRGRWAFFQKKKNNPTMTMHVCKYTHVCSCGSQCSTPAGYASRSLYFTHLLGQRRTKPTNVHKVHARPVAAEVSRAV